MLAGLFDLLTQDVDYVAEHLKWHSPFAWMERNYSPEFLVY
jgi:hypothetical protein